MTDRSHSAMDDILTRQETIRREAGRLRAQVLYSGKVRDVILRDRLLRDLNSLGPNDERKLTRLALEISNIVEIK